MLYAVFSDVHGNLQALEKVRERILREKPDRIVCLGDLVGYGANPNEVAEIVRDMAEIVLAGNHDHAAVGLTDLAFFNHYAYLAALWTSETLSAENHEFLAGLPYSRTENGIHLVHSSPSHPETWGYILSDSKAEIAMAASPEPVVFIGHTHIPMDHHTQRGRMVNVGSIGQPRDGNSAAAFCLYNTDTDEMKLVRVEYDVESAGKAILAAGLPDFLASRLKYGQ